LLSHDVASPLNSLAGLVQLQLNDQVNGQEIKPFLKQVDQRLNDVSSLLFSLVQWSKSQFQGFVSKKTEVDLVRLVNEVVNLFQPIANEKSLRLVNAARREYIVKIDEDMMRVVFRNLISNAIKFAFRDTTITIDVTQEDGNAIITRVSNIGLRLTLCDFFAVDFGSFKPEYFGFKNGKQLTLGDLSLIKQLNHPEVVKDKFCNTCSSRLKFLTFVSQIRQLNESKA
jgi:signal transduction histidine kinase